GNAAKKGVLIKGGIYLEEMGALKAIAFDKTGTLTKGVPVVTDFKMLNNQVNAENMLSIITALEYRSGHPLASAIMKKADEENISYTHVIVDDFSCITGKGIKGTINGTTYYIGNPKLFENLSVDFNNKQEQIVKNLQNQGKTAMMVGTESDILSVIARAEEVRESGNEITNTLDLLGINNIIMLIGDHKGTATAIRGSVRVKDIQAELLPQDKLEFIKQLRSKY